MPKKPKLSSKPFTPRGADDGPLPLPTAEELTAELMAEAESAHPAESAGWDETIPAYAGLLDAGPADEEGLFGQQLEILANNVINYGTGQHTTLQTIVLSAQASLDLIQKVKGTQWLTEEYEHLRSLYQYMKMVVNYARATGDLETVAFRLAMNEMQELMKMEAGDE